MPRRTEAARRLLFAGLLALGAAGCGRERPNLLMISIDTTRADRLGAYGYEAAATPVIDALAAEGFLFRRHLTPVPITLPSHTSLMTGRLPPTHTVHDNGTFVVPQGELMLAELLHDAGYDTAAFVGSFPLSARFGFDQGFEVFDDRFEERFQNELARGRGVFFDERPAAAVVEATLAYHRARKSRRPFFTFVHFFDPHQPQVPPAPYDLRFRQQPYDGEIAAVDEQIGKLFEYLRSTDQWRNTLVVLTADHGEGLGEHGELTHAILLHQATLHIPLILAGPGVAHGETRAWTLATQVFATVLELLGLETPELEPAAGHSLLPLVANGGEPPKGWPRFEGYFETIAPRTSQGWSQLVGWMEGGWRLIHAPRPELYDLDDDPHEQHDRHGEEPKIAGHLAATLRERLPELETASVGASVEDLDPEIAERLAALGYLQASAAELRQISNLLAVEGLTDPKDRVIDISLYSEAKAATVRGNWALAEQLWHEIIRRTPENPGAYHSLALIHGVAGEWAESLAALDSGLAVRPDEPTLLRLKGQLLIESGRPREGLDVLLGLPNESVEATVWIGKAHQALGERDAAEAVFRKGLAIDPEHQWLRLYLANALAERGEIGEAEPIYRELIADYPYFSLAFYNYGKLLMDRGQTDAARRLLERAAQLAPRHEGTQRALHQLATGSAP